MDISVTVESNSSMSLLANLPKPSPKLMNVDALRGKIDGAVGKDLEQR